MAHTLRICYFGTYLRNYPRNKIIIDGLRDNDVEVIECHVDLWRGIEPRWHEIKSAIGKIKLLYKIILAYFKLALLHHDIIRNYDMMIVGYTGHLDMFLARLLASIKRKPLLFDAFVSLYSTFVEDRRMFSPDSFLANLLSTIDKISCFLSDGVFLDTRSHIQYFKEYLHIHHVNFYRVWAGADDTVYFPRQIKKKDEDFIVLFIGGFIPLQGVQYIVKAAHVLNEKQDIKFRLVGAGQEYGNIRKLVKQFGLKNIEFTGWLPYENLPDEIASAHICLGIFGITEKAKKVIPNKVYMAVAMAKPVITGDSPAIREIFTDRKNILLCKMGNPESIAESIMILKENAELRSRLINEGYLLYRKNFAPNVIGRRIKDILHTY
jgi:glycosyltransferase involved in cell wall biosynthesis